jgi:calcium/calmodulin-dependent protein kinase (CaM kinase) II
VDSGGGGVVIFHFKLQNLSKIFNNFISIIIFVDSNTQKKIMDLVKPIKFSYKYTLSEELGAGEFSIVRKCTHLASRQDYAAKIIKTKDLSKRNYDKLEREAFICRQLQHPNIIHLHEVVEEDDYHYLVFDLASGGELFDDIIAKKSYNELQATSFMVQIFGGLKYLHEKNVVHRDLKPENILLVHNKNSADITLKIADFGLAIQMKDENALEWFGFAGTPGYLSPEVLSYQKYGKPVDIWSCGVIFYIILAGYAPFWDDDKNILFNLIKNGRFNYPPNDWSRIGVRTKSLINSMLVVNPRKRISVGEALKIATLNNNHLEFERNIVNVQNEKEDIDWKADYRYVF